MRLPAGLTCTALLLTSATANAFTVSTPVTEACHEQITEAALETARAASAASLTIAPDANERALIDDLPFDVPADMKELAAASLLVGVRDNDLKGRAPTDLDQLALVHGDPRSQEEHCLRAADEDEPKGSAEALGRCAAFIRGRALLALDGLDAHGVPDPHIRQDIDVSLSIRGRVSASLPAFWVRIGQAMHALQDSFSHTYRTDDGMKVTVVLDWIDLVDGHEVESRDGPPHKLDLDECNAGDALRSRNKRLASQASGELLAAVLDPKTTRDQKALAVDAVLVKYLSYAPGCTFGNKWCDAPENAFTNVSTCSVGTVGGAPGGGSTAPLAVGIVVLLGAAARRRRLRGARPRAAVLGCAALTLFSSKSAAAQTADDAPAPSPSTVPSSASPAADGAEPAAKPIPPRTVGEVKQAVKEEKHASFFGLSANVAGAFSDPGLAGAIGARFRVSDRFVLGLDGELNAWYGVNNGRFALGSANFYATGIFRFPMRFESVNLRTTLEAGVAYELLALYGVPSGSVGPFVGVYPLGVEWKASGHLFVVFNPLGVAVPIPHLTGTPFAYPQFRTQLGVEVAL